MLAVLVAGLLAFHAAVPNAVGRPGSLLETFLPWLGLAIPVLLVSARLRRSAAVLPVLLLPVATWFQLFGGLLLSADGSDAHDLTALQHNVSDENADPAGTARALAGARPDLIALEELTPAALPGYAAALAADYPHHAVAGTVGLWSKYPLADARPLDIKPEGRPDRPDPDPLGDRRRSPGPARDRERPPADRRAYQAVTAVDPPLSRVCRWESGGRVRRPCAVTAPSFSAAI